MIGYPICSNFTFFIDILVCVYYGCFFALNALLNLSLIEFFVVKLDPIRFYKEFFQVIGWFVIFTYD